jgi:DNA-binding transcriptional ArsR family regulator
MITFARHDFGHWGAGPTPASLKLSTRQRMNASQARRFVAEAHIAQIGQALAHPLRVRALSVLLAGEAMRAGVLARRLHVALPLMKQHLLRLQESGLVDSERIGEAVYYRLADLAEAIRPLLSRAAPH